MENEIVQPRKDLAQVKQQPEVLKKTGAQFGKEA